MFILILLLWILFNGQLTLEIFLFGLLFASAFYLFICKFFSFSLKKDLAIIKKSLYIIEYLLVLFIEIIKANVVTGKLLLSSKYEVEPVVVKFTTPLKSESARVILANSITLTPGTITVRLQFDEFTVHCLDKTLAKGLNSSIFVKLLMRMEGTDISVKEAED
ncbi:MAG: Na+/H+ antiporter subunit E [Lachnospiraceae bacterium]|nr:Na+/H+ antiporter subunit E [Lachnospiraceae bacterium]